MAGDLEPAIGTTLSDPSNTGPLVDCTVTFILAQCDGIKRIEGNADIIDPVLRTVSYQWAPGDTSLAGVYRAQWKVTFTGGAPETFPSNEPFYIVIAPAL